MQNNTDETEPRSLPVWMSIPIILFCLLAGGWMIHWYVVSDPLAHDEKSLGDPVRQASVGSMPPGRGLAGAGRAGIPGGRNPRNSQLPYMILTDPQNNRWELKTDSARVVVSMDKGKLNIRSIGYNDSSFLPNDVKSTITKTRKLTGEVDRTTKLNLTQPQVTKLRALAFSATNVATSPADKALLSGLLTTFINAPAAQRPALEPKLYQTLDDVSQRSTQLSIQWATDHVNQIDQIMTPDLWKQYTALDAAGK